MLFVFFFFQAEDGIRDRDVTGVQTCALPIFGECAGPSGWERSDVCNTAACGKSIGNQSSPRDRHTEKLHPLAAYKTVYKTVLKLAVFRAILNTRWYYEPFSHGSTLDQVRSKQHRRVYKILWETPSQLSYRQKCWMADMIRRRPDKREPLL